MAYNQTFGSSNLPTGTVDKSLRSTTAPFHTHPGSGLAGNQAGLLNQAGLNQGGFTQGYTQTSTTGYSQGPVLDAASGTISQQLPIGTVGTLQQGGLQQGNWSQSGLQQGGLQQGQFLQQGQYLQQGLPQGGFLQQQGLSQGNWVQSDLQQGGLQQGGLQQGGLQQGGLQQQQQQQHGGFLNRVLHHGQHTQANAQPALTPAALHTSPGMAGGALLAGQTFGHSNVAPLVHQPVIVDKKLRSTVAMYPVVANGLQQQQTFVQQSLPVQQALPIQQNYQQNYQQFQQVQQIPVEHIVRPTIVEQTTRAERLVEVQPIIHREVEAPEVRVIEQHIYESVPSTGPSVINRPAIVEEIVTPRIIEEVQPVIHREVPAPFIERVEQHVTEHITQPTTMTKEVLNLQKAPQPFMAAGGPPTQFIPAGGVQQQSFGQQSFGQTTASNIPVPPPLPTSNKLHSGVSSSSLRV